MITPCQNKMTALKIALKDDKNNICKDFIFVFFFLDLSFCKNKSIV